MGSSFSTKDAGTIQITNADHIGVINGGKISTTTYSTGNAGKIIIEARALIINGNGIFTGLLSFADSGSKGNGGEIDLSISDTLTLLNQGLISTNTFAFGDAGSIAISGQNLTVDGDGIFSGITSNAQEGSQGDAGSIIISLSGLLEIVDEGQISSVTAAKGDAGSITISAEKISIDGQDHCAAILCQAEEGSSGNAGSIIICQSGEIELKNGAHINSSSFSTGAAGHIRMDADSLSITGEEERAGVFNSTAGSAEQAKDSGNIVLNLSGALTVKHSGEIDSSTSSHHDAGDIIISADNILIDGEGYATGISSFSEGIGDSGSIKIMAQNAIDVRNGGKIGATSNGEGDSGDISIYANSLTMDGFNKSDPNTIIASYSQPNAKGNAGKIEITVQDKISIVNGASISCSSWSTGSGGDIAIESGSLLLDGRQVSDEGFNGIASKTYRPSSEGTSGNIDITTNGEIYLIKSTIVSSTTSKGDAGNISIKAGELFIDGQGNLPENQDIGIMSQALEASEGDAGHIQIISDSDVHIVDGGEIMTNTLSKGNAGSINLQISDTLEMRGQSLITNDTYSVGDAGTISISTKNIIIDGRGERGGGIFSSAVPNSRGNAGDINITAADTLTIADGGEIGSNTNFSKGGPGKIVILASNLLLDGQGYVAAITNQTNGDSEGNAGEIAMTISNLAELTNGGIISTSSSSRGNAGDISIQSPQLTLNKGFIESNAKEGSTGLVGNINIQCNTVIMTNDSGITNESKAIMQSHNPVTKQSKISVTSDDLTLDNGSMIGSASFQNVPANDIEMQTSTTILKNGSTINTSSNNANAGNIDWFGNLLYLENGLISTSVFGTTGDGGNITIQGVNDKNNINKNRSAEYLILKKGFIKANTDAENAKGGEIFIDSNHVIVDATTPLQIGGERKDFTSNKPISVIQAAAPKGEHGTIHLNAPDLDISGSVINIDSKMSELVPFEDSPCSQISPDQVSSLFFEEKKEVQFSLDNASSVFLSKERLKDLLKCNTH